MICPTLAALAVATALLLPSTATAQETLVTDPPLLQFVESVPVGTTLDHPGMPEAHEVWVEVIDGASERIELAHFYASNSERGDRLERVIQALQRAGERGVAVRFLAEKKFQETYPATLARLGAMEGIEVRILDTATAFGGSGVLHAKMMLVDEDIAFVGSQNFDWRALEHIQELGLLSRVPQVREALGEIFERDWALAAGEEPPHAHASREPRFPLQLEQGEQPLELSVVASPRSQLPDARMWDLPRLIGLIDGAETSVKIQLLSYYATTRERKYFEGLDAALRRAAARRVEVKLIVANWSKKPWVVPWLKSLHVLPNVDVAFMDIPEHEPTGHVPFGRVVHSKYMVVDGARFWLGTSNWSRDYFFDSRNVGLVVEHAGLASELEAYFDGNWASEYLDPVDPGKPDDEYSPPPYTEGE